MRGVLVSLAGCFFVLYYAWSVLDNTRASEHRKHELSVYEVVNGGGGNGMMMSPSSRTPVVLSAYNPRSELVSRQLDDHAAAEKRQMRSGSSSSCSVGAGRGVPEEMDERHLLRREPNDGYFAGDQYNLVEIRRSYRKWKMAKNEQPRSDSSSESCTASDGHQMKDEVQVHLPEQSETNSSQLLVTSRHNTTPAGDEAGAFTTARRIDFSAASCCETVEVLGDLHRSSTSEEQINLNQIKDHVDRAETSAPNGTTASKALLSPSIPGYNFIQMINNFGTTVDLAAIKARIGLRRQKEEEEKLRRKQRKEAKDAEVLDSFAVTSGNLYTLLHSHESQLAPSSTSTSLLSGNSKNRGSSPRRATTGTAGSCSLLSDAKVLHARTMREQREMAEMRR